MKLEIRKIDKLAHAAKGRRPVSVAGGHVADWACALAYEGRRGGSGTSQRRMTVRPTGQPLPFQLGRPIDNVYYGACSWTDRTLIDAGTFYPPSVRTAADRLAHYASQFPSRWTRSTTRCRRSATHAFGGTVRRPASSSTSKPSACSGITLLPPSRRRAAADRGKCRRKRWRRCSPPASSAASCFNSRTGSPPGALTSATLSNSATAASGRLPLSSAAAAR
jgi:hypothetical protein